MRVSHACAVRAMHGGLTRSTKVVRVPLADGYLFTAQNEGSVGTIYWMKCRRTITSTVTPAGKAYEIGSTCSTAIASRRTRPVVRAY